MTLIYPVEDEVFLCARRDVLDEVVGTIEHALSEGFYAHNDDMRRQLNLFAISLRAHAQHLPLHLPQEPTGSKSDLAQGWLDI